MEAQLCNINKAEVIRCTNSFRDEILITRIVQARPWKVFKAWTNEKLVEKWWGPNGCEKLCNLDATRGGEIYIELKAADGTIFPVKGNFKEIDEPEQLVFTAHAFYDEKEKPKLKVLHTVIFIAERYNTRLTLQAVIMKSAAGVDTTVKDMEANWNESLDKLETLLLRLKFNCFQSGKSQV